MNIFNVLPKTFLTFVNSQTKVEWHAALSEMHDCIKHVAAWAQEHVKVLAVNTIMHDFNRWQFRTVGRDLRCVEVIKCCQNGPMYTQLQLDRCSYSWSSVSEAHVWGQTGKKRNILTVGNRAKRERKKLGNVVHHEGEAFGKTVRWKMWKKHASSIV